MKTVNGIHTRAGHRIMDAKAAAQRKVWNVYAELDRELRAIRKERDAELGEHLGALLTRKEAA